MINRNNVSLIPLVLLVAGCAVSPDSDQLTTSLIPESNQARYSANIERATLCQLHLHGIEDQRSNTDIAVRGQSISQAKIKGWLSTALNSMNVNSEPSDAGSVNVVLSKVFVTTLGSNTTTNVILGIQHRKNNNDAFSEMKMYRGQSVMSKSENDDNNVDAAFIDAINQASRRVKTALMHHCS